MPVRTALTILSVCLAAICGACSMPTNTSAGDPSLAPRVALRTLDPFATSNTVLAPERSPAGLEAAAIERCRANRGGRRPAFEITGFNCYVFFPTTQRFELPAPPPDDVAEAQLLVPMAAMRSPDVMASILAQAQDPMPAFWATAGIDPVRVPALEETVRAVLNDGANLTLKVKAEFSRTRPHIANSQVKPAIEVPWHSSYPSGHATQAMLAALVLGCLNPSAQTALDALAVSVGRNREIAGVHYPSDTEAGFLLGRMIFDELRKNPSFGLCGN